MEFFDKSVPARRHEVLSESFKWSTLAKIGRSPLIKLTLLVPFVGTLLAFSDGVANILALADFFQKDADIEDGNAFIYTNLYFSYFGLCSLALGSLLFLVFCPREISDEPNETNFVTNSATSDTPTLAKASFRAVLEIHFKSRHDLERPDFHMPNPEYPDDLEGDFHNLMEELYSKYTEEEDPSEAGSDFPEVMLPTGYLDFTDLARMLYENQRVVWPITLPFFALVPDFARDISFVKFRSLEYTRYAVRCYIALFYSIGFVLISLPTLRTFFVLFLGLF